MAKYHIKDNGEPGKCNAFLKPCPLGGGDEDHFPTKELAREAYEAKMAEEAVALVEADRVLAKRRKEFFANMDKPGYVLVSKNSNEVMNTDGAYVDDGAIVDYDEEGNPINSIEAINARKVKLSSVRDMSVFKDPIITHEDNDEYFRPNDVVVVEGNIDYDSRESDTLDVWNPTVNNALKARDRGESFAAWDPTVSSNSNFERDEFFNKDNNGANYTLIDTETGTVFGGSGIYVLEAVEGDDGDVDLDSSEWTPIANVKDLSSYSNPIVYEADTETIVSAANLHAIDTSKEIIDFEGVLDDSSIAAQEAHDKGFKLWD